MSMLANYLKITLRSLTKAKTYAFINLFGLAVGMAACVLIGLYIRSELSFDRFHASADRIYRVIEEFVPIQQGARNLVIATTPGPWAAALLNDFPEIERAVRFHPAGRMLIEYEGERFYEERFAWTDSSVFDMFTFPLLRGDRATALASPNTIVISESAARRYFGEENPVGKTISAGTSLGDCYEITGVMQDMPARSHLRFDFLASMSGWSFSDPLQWMYHNYYTYLLLGENASAASVESKLPDFLDRHMGEALTAELGTEFRPTLQRLRHAHLHSSHINEDIAPQGNIRYVYVFSIIAVFVLLIACVNFMNLTTARSAIRAREVGLRKVMGARRWQLIRQFLGEAVLLAFIALFAALVLVWMLRPAMNHLSGGALSASTIDVTFVVGLVVLTVVVGVLAGSYPALFLSGFHPIT